MKWVTLHGEKDEVNSIRTGGGRSMTKKHSWDMIKQINTNENKSGWIQQQKRIYCVSGIAPTLSKSESANHPMVLLTPPI